MRPTRERIEAYYFKPGYELDGYADEYEVLFRADGSQVTFITEPEDRNFYRDFAPVLAELNALALEADTLRTALERLLAATHHAFHAPVAGTGDAEAMVAAYEAARVALGGEK